MSSNLKQDILNKLGNEKFYTEMELVREAGDPNMVYLNKVESMVDMLKRLASIDLAVQLTGQYFPDQVQQPVSNPKSDAHPGQTHGE